MDLIHCEDDTIRIKIKYFIENPSNFFLETLLLDNQYDHYFTEWFGDYSWKLIYRASEHEFTTSSFHEYCNDKGPAIVIVKSIDGWIFGGYTSKEWKYRKYTVCNQFGGRHRMRFKIILLS